MGKRPENRLDKKQRGEFLAEGRRLNAAPETRHLADCWLCHMPIDYDVDPATTPDSHTLDHYYDVHTYPELQNDPDNFRHAHFSCNSSRGKRAPNNQGLGEPMPAWW